MKKFLEVLVDDDGQLQLSTDYEFADNVDNPPSDMMDFMARNDDLNRKAIRGMINQIWKNKEQHTSKAIRYLAMAEIMACAEPYDHAEHFWSAMMFDYIPRYEKLANKLKRPFGYDPSKMIRPITFSPGTSMMPISGFNGFSGFTGFGPKN